MASVTSGRRALSRAGWGLAALGLAGLVMPFGVAHAAPVTNGACSDAEESQFLDLINEYRAENGLGTLTLSQSLSNASEYHSQDMATKGYFEHTMPDGTTVEQNVRNHGYRGTTFGENIVAGTETAEEALQAWKDSPAHNENMLRPAFNAIGIGRYYIEGSPYGWYWTTDFGGTVDRVGAVCGQASTGAAAPDAVAPAALTGDGAVTAEASGDTPARERSGGRRKAVTNDPDVNLRTGPGRDYPVIEIVDEGTAFEVDGAPLNGYLPVLYGGQEVWIAEEWVDVQEESPSDSTIEMGQTIGAPAPVAAPEPTVIETINMRAQPQHDATVITMVMTDDAVNLTGNSANGFLEATYQGSTGWLDAQYVNIPAAPAETAAPTEQAASIQTYAAQSPTSEDAIYDESLIGLSAVATDPLNLRTGPSREAAISEVVPAGTSLPFNGQRDGGYFGVTWNGLDLWADAAYLR